jgi:hypothetical protein
MTFSRRRGRDRAPEVVLDEDGRGDRRADTELPHVRGEAAGDALVVVDPDDVAAPVDERHRRRPVEWQAVAHRHTVRTRPAPAAERHRLGVAHEAVGVCGLRAEELPHPLAHRREDGVGRRLAHDERRHAAERPLLLERNRLPCRHCPRGPRWTIAGEWG